MNIHVINEVMNIRVIIYLFVFFAYICKQLFFFFGINYYYYTITIHWWLREGCGTQGCQSCYFL